VALKEGGGGSHIRRRGAALQGESEKNKYDSERDRRPKSEERNRKREDYGNGPTGRGKRDHLNFQPRPGVREHQTLKTPRKGKVTLEEKEEHSIRKDFIQAGGGREAKKRSIGEKRTHPFFLGRAKCRKPKEKNGLRSDGRPAKSRGETRRSKKKRFLKLKEWEKGERSEDEGNDR